MVDQSPSYMGGTPCRPPLRVTWSMPSPNNAMNINQYEMQLPDIGRINVPTPSLGPHVR